ncbi:glycerophosphodiester phosphodiesterase [Mytilus galloprovincialis]|uniref:Glycerophosphodiester phosphodiesterase n=1 Tax=Mytilus galloprovincialis TaxID=29158 RepID=A0A8B6BQE6_MYTGA|nr:glycerophosphodiester phosphodiesterase [Mytilus galloprovincialis]
MASSTLSQEEENYVRMSLLLTGISPRAVRVLFDKEFPPASLSLTVNDKKVKQKLNDLSKKRVINKVQWDLLFPISEVKQDIKKIKLDHDKSKKDMKVLTFRQANLKRSHNLLQHKQNVSNQQAKRFKKDVNRLELDQINVKVDVKKLKSTSEDPVPWNRREQISKQLDKWQKNSDNFVETRAAKCVLKGIKENSCLTITASSGVGKTSILRHVALKMKEKEGYDVLPVTYPNDIIQFNNPNQKTLFVIDNFCGTYSINQSDIDNWESVMEQIKMLIENKLTKIIVACRLQVYQDEKFESLSIFRTSVCNLRTKDLCLSETEKTTIAEIYLKTKASEIIQYCNLYDFFPLLCKLYNESPEVNITEFFKNPFSVYETEINKLNKKGHYRKYCAMALCVMFNNNLKEEMFSDEINVETRKIIKETCEACRLDRGTSRLVLLDELNSLEHTFIKKEHGIIKTKHDKLFDFLAYYFGQKMIQCIIRNAYSVFIMQRFLLERKDYMDQFITIVPPKYHQMYMQRMIDDWSIGRLDCVFSNINWEIQEFRHKFLCYLKKVEMSLQRQLALKCDINSKNTALIGCCHYEYILFIYWCIDHGGDVNLCNRTGGSPLLVASVNGHTETVKVLLDNKADSNKCLNNEVSPLYVACQNNHIETVKLLLDNEADINKCRDNGTSPLYIACQNIHTEIVKILLDNKADINKCTDNGASPLHIACHNNHTETVKILLDNKADINKCMNDGASPLHIACQNNYTETVKVLLDNKADINKCDDNGASPLYIACQNNHTELVKILLDNKADINKCMKYGVSPLLIACQNIHTEIVKILLDNKADINKCKDNGASPLFIACENNHIEIVKVLLDNKADINKCRDNGTFPLYIACQNNHIETVKLYLLDIKADINKCTDTGISPLYIACQNNHLEIVKILLDNKAIINKCTDTGTSPLYIACQNNHLEIVKILLDNKADIYKFTNNGISPKQIASDKEYSDILAVINEYSREEVIFQRK